MHLNHIVFIAILVFCVGCTPKHNAITFPVHSSKAPPINIQFEVDSENETSSELSFSYLEQFCNVQFVMEIERIYSESNWEPRAEVIFSHKDSDERFSVIYYYEKAEQQFLTLIKSSEEEDAEWVPDGNFLAGQSIRTMLGMLNNQLILSVGTNQTYTEFGKATGTPATVKFHFVDIGFTPDMLTFRSIAAKAKFSTFDIKNQCEATEE